MSFSRYPAYKNSGVGWLGDVPEHWEVIPVKRCLRAITQGWSPQCESYPADAEQWGVLKVGCVNGGSFDPSQNKALPPALEPLPELSIREGDVLVSRANTRELVGSVAVAERDYERLMLCDKLYRLRVDEQRCDATFLARSLSTPAARGVIEAAASGASSSMLNIGHASILGMLIAVPPLKEQQTLVDFVRGEAIKIDVLVEEQRRLIELLKEKRQAVISQAVTKGLNPNAPTKDSGVKWLGRVPAHWQVAPIKSFGWLKGGAGFPHEDQGIHGEELNFFKVAALGGGSSGVIDQAEHTISRRTAARLGAYVFPGGTVVFAKVGAALLLGRVRLLSADACIDNNMMGIVPHESVNAEFLRLAMSLVRFDLIANPGAIPSLNEGQIGNFALAKPPAEEQRAIAKFVKVETARIDSLTFEAQRGVDLLQERRSALISAAVTGKIDVRGLVPQSETVAA